MGASLLSPAWAALLWLDLKLWLALSVALWAVSWLPPLCLAVPWLPRRVAGVAFPGLILLHRERGWFEDVLRHELEHQRQFRRWSPLGLVLTARWHRLRSRWCGLVREGRWVGRQELYEACPFERAANLAMDRVEPLPAVWGRVPGPWVASLQDLFDAWPRNPAGSYQDPACFLSPSPLAIQDPRWTVTDHPFPEP